MKHLTKDQHLKEKGFSDDRSAIDYATELSIAYPEEVISVIFLSYGFSETQYIVEYNGAVMGTRDKMIAEFKNGKQL